LETINEKSNKSNGKNNKTNPTNNIYSSINPMWGIIPINPILQEKIQKNPLNKIRSSIL